MPHLELRVTDYEGDTAWRWELRDAAGAFLADRSSPCRLAARGAVG